MSSVNALIVHSSAELYGSDKSLLDFVRGRDAGIRVTVFLPEEGPLCAALRDAGAVVHVANIGKIRRDMLGFFGFLSMLTGCVSSLFVLARAHRREKFNVVYSNTIAVLGGAIFAKIFRVPHVWHVREISEGGKSLTRAFRLLVSFFSKSVICNSNQTLEWICPARSERKFSVIWNGYDAKTTSFDREGARQTLGIATEDVLFVFVGRLNGWKGQELLVQAFSDVVRLPGPPVRLVLFGSAAKGQGEYEESLDRLIHEKGLSALVRRFPFRDDIEVAWASADVVVVPSTSPEPFGRVAIEAMSFGCPVLAAAHGGLLDIVEDGKSGVFFEPGSRDALAAAMQKMRIEKGFRLEIGDAGRIRQMTMFSVEKYARSVSSVLISATL